jgi:uncharacterized protein YndB with AHSA1/START domain
MTDLQPIRVDRRLPVAAETAFAAFSDGIGAWWDPAYSANADTFSGAVMENRVGGRIYGVHTDLGEVSWGSIVAWEPGTRLAWSWTLAQNRDHPSLLEVAFEPDPGGSVLRLSHGGWNEDNAASRHKFGDWPHILDRFVDHVRRIATTGERCEHCGRDVALGTPLFARRVTLISEDDPDVAFVCLDCRKDANLVDADGNPLDESQLAGMKYVVGRGGRA